MCVLQQRFSMMLVRRGTAGTTLIVVLLLRESVLSDYPPPHADISGYYTARRDPKPVGGCVTLPANMTLCRGVGYNSVRLPNPFGHETLGEAAEHANSWVLLVNIHCHPDTQVSCTV